LRLSFRHINKAKPPIQPNETTRIFIISMTVGLIVEKECCNWVKNVSKKIILFKFYLYKVYTKNPLKQLTGVLLSKKHLLAYKLKKNIILDKNGQTGTLLPLLKYKTKFWQNGKVFLDTCLIYFSKKTLNLKSKKSETIFKKVLHKYNFGDF
jgi:hypothetical protein